MTYRIRGRRSKKYRFSLCVRDAERVMFYDGIQRGTRRREKAIVHDNVPANSKTPIALPYAELVSPIKINSTGRENV